MRVTVGDEVLGCAVVEGEGEVVAPVLYLLVSLPDLLLLQDGDVGPDLHVIICSRVFDEAWSSAGLVIERCMSWIDNG